MSLKKNVLILTPGFPENENDSDCISPLQEYLKELLVNYSDLNISVIAVHYPYKRSVYLWNGITVYACGAKNCKQPLRLYYWCLSVLYALAINRNSKINLVHSFWLNETALIGSIICRLLKVKHVNTMMGQEVKQKNKYLKIINLKNIFKVALTGYQSKFFYQAFKMNPDKIISWGIKSFDVADKPRTIDLLGVGSLIPVKNFSLFIKIIKNLKDEFKTIKCVIIGQGEQYEELQGLIFKYGLSDNILLTGLLSRELVLSKMKESKILLHTSNYESFGFVIAEALAAGCYVVSREVGCASQSDKLFSLKENVQFETIISNLLKNAAEFNPKNLFPVEYTAQMYAELYGNLSTGLE